MPAEAAAGGGAVWMASASGEGGCGAVGGVGSFTADMASALKPRKLRINKNEEDEYNPQR